MTYRALRTQSPVVVVFFCANPLDISPLLSNVKVGAVMHVGQPSTTIYGAICSAERVLLFLSVTRGRLSASWLSLSP